MIFILSIFLNLNLVWKISEAFNAIWPADKTINQRNENKKCWKQTNKKSSKQTKKSSSDKFFSSRHKKMFSEKAQSTLWIMAVQKNGPKLHFYVAVQNYSNPVEAIECDPFEKKETKTLDKWYTGTCNVITLSGWYHWPDQIRQFPM